jgi:anti-anti-sigma factor
MKESADITKETFDFMNLSVNLIIDDHNDICAMILNGSMDTESVMEFRGEMKEMLIIRRYDFIVDVNNVTYISSTALGFLMFLAAHKKNFVYLSSPPKKISKSLKVLGIHPMFKFYNNVEDLKKEKTIPESIIQHIAQKAEIQEDVKYHERWLKILRDHLAYTQIVEEVHKLEPYRKQADHGDSITLPSDKKYSCILYRFLERIFRRVAKIDSQEIEDEAIEIIATELMENAVRHGYDFKKEGVVEANFKIDSEKLEINFIDYGKGFKDSAEKIFPPAGLKIIKNIFDDVSVKEAPKKEVQGLVEGKGTTVAMIKYLTPKY